MKCSSHFGVHHVLKRSLGELWEQTGVVLAKTQQRRQIAISLGALDDKKTINAPTVNDIRSLERWGLLEIPMSTAAHNTQLAVTCLFIF